MIPAVFPALFAILFSQGIDPQTLVRNMELAYGKVEDYRMEVEVVKPAEDGSLKDERFTYTYKKPKRVRIDFHTPHRGTKVVYPCKEGKVFVRPWGWRALDLCLEPDSLLLRESSGQRVDQTDLGLLIRNIARSMTEGRRGPLEISEGSVSFLVTVLAADHFREGEVTLYTFAVDKRSWMPQEITESTAGGSLKRRILFRDIQINLGISDRVFLLNGE